MTTTQLFISRIHQLKETRQHEHQLKKYGKVIRRNMEKIYTDTGRVQLSHKPPPQRRRAGWRIDSFCTIRKGTTILYQIYNKPDDRYPYQQLL